MKNFTLLKYLAQLLLLLISVDLAAQTTTYPTTYQTTSYTSYQLGDYTYTRSSTGPSYTSYRLGEYTYTSGSDGTRLTSYSLGAYTYTTGVGNLPPVLDTPARGTTWDRTNQPKKSTDWLYSTTKREIDFTTARSPKKRVSRRRQ